MGQQVGGGGELNRGGGAGKPPKSPPPDPKSGDLAAGRPTGPEPPRAAPVSVAKLWDDLRLGVISQPSPVIAGFLRNISQYDGPGLAAEVGRPSAEAMPRPLDASNAAATWLSQTWAR